MLKSPLTSVLKQPCLAAARLTAAFCGGRWDTAAEARTSVTAPAPAGSVANHACRAAGAGAKTGAGTGAGTAGEGQRGC